MSLDIYLKAPHKTTHRCECFECGDIHEREKQEIFFQANITHNLGRMAKAANIYTALWHPEQLDIKTARDLSTYLEGGITLMENTPELFKSFNAPNGWGMYDNFLPWLKNLLTACQDHPEALIEVSIWAPENHLLYSL